jgi:hypothetical protein
MSDDQWDDLADHVPAAMAFRQEHDQRNQRSIGTLRANGRGSVPNVFGDSAEAKAGTTQFVLIRLGNLYAVSTRQIFFYRKFLATAVLHIKSHTRHHSTSWDNQAASSLALVTLFLF